MVEKESHTLHLDGLLNEKVPTSDDTMLGSNEISSTARTSCDSDSFASDDENLPISIQQCSHDQLKVLLKKRLRNIYSENNSVALPRFDRNEVAEGKVLGRGEWGIVCEVRRFCIDNSGSSSQEQEIDGKDVRNSVSANCFQEGGDCRYAIKRLKRRQEIESKSEISMKVAEAGFDMAVETTILSSLKGHPNIIKLYGTANEPMFSPESFIILDRLYQTLQQSLILWKQEKKGQIKITRSHQDLLSLERAELNAAKKTPPYLAKQIKAARDLSSALAYIHQKGIMHRDLKPQNIAFALNGDLKVFDFAMARVMPKTADDECRYNFTKMCGSLRYMAPEVGLGEPYNESCDVFSFAILLWEILSLESAYGTLFFDSPSRFQDHVWKKGQRPSQQKRASGFTSIRASLAWWSPRIVHLLEDCWSSEINIRYSMKEVEQILIEEDFEESFRQARRGPVGLLMKALPPVFKRASSGGSKSSSPEKAKSWGKRLPGRLSKLRRHRTSEC